MEVSYNLRYTKSGFSNKLLLDKEGEVVIYQKGFRLKGKGASDKGELINFSEVKEFYYRNEKIIFVTFSKEKYVLSESGTLFDQLLLDLYRARNEFLMDALFMKSGKLKSEFECEFKRNSKFGKPINHGHGKIRLYERSLVVVPSTQDAFSIHYDFVNYHEFDEIEYSLKIAMEDGTIIYLSRLGNDFDLFQEKMNILLGGMYDELVNGVLKRALPEFHAVTLLKLAYKMKGGKAIALKDIEKIDENLAVAVNDFVLENAEFAEKINFLKEQVDSHNTFFGIAKDPTVAEGFVRWIMFAIPEENTVCFSVLPRWKEGDETVFSPELMFYRIIMEKGIPAEKVADKISEINQSLVILNFAKDPCYKDKRELKHSPYQYAIRKLPFLRILRKSFVEKINIDDIDVFKKKIKGVYKKTSLEKNKKS